MELIVDNNRQDHLVRRWLIIIISISILLRVAAAFYLGDHVEPMPGTYDQVSYDRLAVRFQNGYGFTFDKLWWPYTHPGEPTAHWSFLYTLYLSAVYSLVGYHPLVARLIQAIIVGALMPWLVYRLGKRHFNPQVGLVASALMAGYAYFIYYAGTLMTENFYILGILWILDLTGQLGESRSAIGWRGILLGLALGMTVLLRQVFLFFIPVLFAWLLWRSYRHQAGFTREALPENGKEGLDKSTHHPGALSTYLRKHPVARMMVILSTATLILILAIAPWTIRNYKVFHRFVLLNTNAGFAFYWANHPIHGRNSQAVLPTWSSYVELIPPELLSMNEAEIDHALLKLGFGFVFDDPVRYLMLSISRIKPYFVFWTSSESSLISNISRVLSFGLLWPFMLYGVISQARRSLSSETLIFYLFVIIYTGIHLLSWALIRYRLPVDAILLIFASTTFVELGMKVNKYFVKPRQIKISKTEAL